MAHQFLKLICPHCDKALKIPAEKSGKKITCPQCHSQLQILAPEATQPEPNPVNSIDGPLSDRDFDFVDDVLRKVNQPEEGSNSEPVAMSPATSPEETQSPASEASPQISPQVVPPVYSAPYSGTPSAVPIQPTSSTEETFDESDENSLPSSPSILPGVFAEPSGNPISMDSDIAEETEWGPERLGSCLFACEQNSSREAIEHIFGGPVLLYFTGPLIGMIAAFFLTGILSIIVVPFMKSAPTGIRIAILVFFSVLSLAVVFGGYGYWIWRHLQHIKGAIAEVRQKGCYIVAHGRTHIIPFKKMHSVYFGTRNNLSNAALDLTALIQPFRTEAARRQMSRHFVVELKDGTCIKLNALNGVFTEASVNRFNKLVQDKLGGKSKSRRR